MKFLVNLLKKIAPKVFLCHNKVELEILEARLALDK